MRGKIVNISLGLLNILLGVLIAFFAYYVPQDITQVTVQEDQVKSYIIIAIYAVMTIVLLLNLAEWVSHNKDGDKYYGCVLILFSLLFVVFKDPAVGLFAIVSGLMLIDKTRKANLVESNSTAVISIILLVMVSIGIIGTGTYFYKQIGTYIKDKENENELKYKQDYFRYITELGINEPYINVKRGDKFGYVNMNGQEVIGFKYDYASPFINISSYDKNFQVALVCENGSSYIILKNERKVLSYRSESSDENYEAKIEELQDIYTNTLKQQGQMSYEMNKITENKLKLPVYANTDQVTNKGYTYRYDYNTDYDLLVTQSQLGLDDKYELARKEDIDFRFSLDCEHIDYDENFAYIFSNNTIPYYDTSKREQGWFTQYGKKTTMSGKAQILDFFDNYLLIRNYNTHMIYFIDSANKVVSEQYKDIYVCNDCYIVKTKDNKYKFIDKNFQKIIEDEFDIVFPYYCNYGIFIVGNTANGVNFNNFSYADMDLKIINLQGQVLLDGIGQIYGDYFKISTDKSKNYASRYTEFLENVKDVEYNFVGDKFYLEERKDK